MCCVEHSWQHLEDKEDGPEHHVERGDARGVIDALVTTLEVGVRILLGAG